MFVRLFAIAVVTLSGHASAKSFYDYCLKPDNAAQTNTITRMLRAVGLPAGNSEGLCAEGQRKLLALEELTFALLTVHHGFSTEVVEPISDLRPLESLVGLKKLSLEGPTIREAFALQNPLVPLLSLRELTLKQIPLPHVDFVAAVPLLESLTLTNTETRDLGALEKLPSLTRLDLSGNPLSDLSVLAKLPRLKHFTFESHTTNGMLTDLEFVRPLTGLQTLKLTGHKIKYLFPLAGLTQLRVLDLGDNRVMDVEPLLPLQKLEELALNSNNIHDISLLAKLPALTTLNLAVNHITDARVLDRLVNLRTIDLSGNNVGHLTLHNLAKLENLRALSCGLTSLYGIPENNVLKHLDLSHNKLTSLDRMAFMTGLESASFYENEITEIWQLASHDAKKLRHLSLTRNKITGVEPLKNYRSLEQLNIQDNLVKDFSPLSALEAPHANADGKTIRLWILR